MSPGDRGLFTAVSPEQSEAVRLVLIGAMSGVLLERGGVPTASAVVWQVDWSEYGAGRALILWEGGPVRTIGPDRRLAHWLADTISRHTPDLTGLPWRRGVHEHDEVVISRDLDRGLRAHARDVVVEVTGPLDRRVVDLDQVDVGGVPFRLRHVLVPCAEGWVSVNGRRLLGHPRRWGGADVPGSTAVITLAGTWER